jgi:tetratricopeptide (TPR) repeat protein
MSRLEKLQKLVSLAPADPMTHYGLGLEYINLQQWENAVEAFDRAIGVDAKYSAAYYHKARALISASRNADARATLQAGIQAATSAGDWHTQSEMTALLETIPE